MNETGDFTEPKRDWLADRVRRIPPGAWPFVLLAGLVVVVYGRALFSNGSLDLLLLASLAAGALLPAAILIGCPDAWRSARLVLAGAIVWTSVPFIVDVISSGQQWLSVETLTDTPTVSGLEIVQELARTLSLAGPALVALGLLTRRRTETTWPKALVAPALIGTAVLCVYAASSATGQNATLQGFSGTSSVGTLRDQLFVVVLALQPLRILTLGALAWSSLSAVRATEEPRRFWLSVFVGSAVLLGLTILLIILGLAEMSGALAADTYMAVIGPILWAETLGGIVGMGLLLVGFGLGLPAADPMAGGDETVASVARLS